MALGRLIATGSRAAVAVCHAGKYGIAEVVSEGVVTEGELAARGREGFQAATGCLKDRIAGRSVSRVACVNCTLARILSGDRDSVKAG